MRLIDADGLVKYKVTGEIGNLSGDFIPGFAIGNATTIDAVPVVRCNECKHYETDTGFCHYWETGLHWDDFCSKGVKANAAD